LDGVDVPAGGSAYLVPGGYHVMLIGLNGPLLEETTINVTLEFERAGKVEIEAIVESAGYRGPKRFTRNGMPMKSEGQGMREEMHKGMHK
ncbi:MAG: copper chaperone PCu(A)C, partial [Alphaproteobacteria bacterium]